ncbi:MAG: MFS transporter, partial [Myxococcota bacterium]
MDTLRKYTGLDWGFWMLCLMEMWERLAYYGVRLVVAVYIAQADEPGGLHLTQADKGTIYFWWFMFQSVLPSFTGGFADRYGYKRTIFVSIVLKLLGYVMMANLRSYWGFFAGTMMLATGTAIFKPGIQGSLAQSLNRSNASKGWGVFYWLVNVGALIGGPLAGQLRDWGWPAVFYGCAVIVSLNFIMLFTYEEVESNYQGAQDPVRVFIDTIKNIVEPRLVAWLVIMSGFWLMMYQLWDLHPNFITDWIDSRSVVAALSLPESWTTLTERGLQIKQEILISLNSLMIVLFMVPVSILVAKMRTLTAMVYGMTIATMGILVSGDYRNGWIFVLGVVLFSCGEMLTGPKKQEYLGLIAPPGKKGLYLGYVNIPVGIGGGFGALLAGWLYG